MKKSPAHRRTKPFRRNTMPRRTDRPKWILRGDSIVSMIIGGAFLGVMIAQFPGAIVGAIFGAIVGWLSTKTKPDD